MPETIGIFLFLGAAFDLEEETERNHAEVLAEFERRKRVSPSTMFI